MATPSCPGKATARWGCWKAQREKEGREAEEPLQTMQMPRRASCGACSKVTAGLFYSLGITVKIKESTRKGSVKEMYWIFPNIIC